MCKCFINYRSAKASYENNSKSSDGISVFMVTSSHWPPDCWVSVYTRFYAETVRGAFLTEQAFCLLMIHENTNEEL